MKNVLVTGFGPFGVYKRNPSSDIVDALQKQGIPDINIITEKLSVVYSEVKEVVPALWKKHSPDFVCHIGVHPVVRCIKLEKQAFADGYVRDDINGCTPENNSTCCPASEKFTVLTSTHDLEKVVSDVSKKLELDFCPLQLTTSEDPGRYLCSFSYYLSLNEDRQKSLFIHVPEFDDECTLELVTSVVKEVILELVK